MLIEQMEVGNSIDIVVERGDFRFRLRSKIERVGKGRFYISPIMSSTRVFQFRPQDNVTIIYHADRSMWIWEKVNAETVLIQEQYMNVFSSRQPGKSYNRRESYRMSINEEYTFWHYVPLTEEEKEQKRREQEFLAQRMDEMDFDNLDMFGGENLFIEEDGFRIYPFDGLIKNLSETGVAFFANRELMVGDLVQFEIQATNGPIVCRAEVVRIEEERTTKYHKMFGCHFIQSGKELPKYLFELQREKLRKSRTIG